MTPPRGPVVVVHNLAQARATLAAARHAGRPVTLASPPAAAATLGPLVFREMVAVARLAVPDAESLAVLDCGDAAGDAMAAIRAGVEAISLAADDDVLARIGEIAAEAGVRVLPRPVADLDLAGVVAADIAAAETALGALFDATRKEVP